MENETSSCRNASFVECDNALSALTLKGQTPGEQAPSAAAACARGAHCITRHEHGTRQHPPYNRTDRCARALHERQPSRRALTELTESDCAGAPFGSLSFRGGADTRLEILASRDCEYVSSARAFSLLTCTNVLAPFDLSREFWRSTPLRARKSQPAPSFCIAIIIFSSM